MDIQKILQRVDWDFRDFSSRSYKLDINNIHWYPASFVPQIPSIMIQLLSKEGDIVLDPFVGSGVTLIEATKVRRNPIGVDINPFAVDIAKAKFQAITFATDQWKENLKQEVLTTQISESAETYCRKHKISDEVFKWFEKNTLTELLCIYDVVMRNNRKCFLLEKILLSSILHRSCSQRRHYTYITDGCYPDEFEYINAKKLFLEQVELVTKSSKFFKEQYKRRYFEEYKQTNIRIEVGDARNLGFISDKSVDLIVTSPPYLGTHDYLKSMRLTNLFFPELNYKIFLENEIGARFKRQRKNAFEEYLNDMFLAFKECYRVLKPGGFLGMTLGKGKGKVIKMDVLKIFLDFLTNKLNFSVVYSNIRRISNRRIRFPGVITEHVIVLKKQNGGL
jgi:DNA modification methylase